MQIVVSSLLRAGYIGPAQNFFGSDDWRGPSARKAYRERALDTRLDTLNLRVPKLRQGSYFPGFLEARKTSEQASVAVILEAWIGGASTRLVDELVQAMGLGDISKSTVSERKTAPSPTVAAPATNRLETGASTDRIASLALAVTELGDDIRRAQLVAVQAQLAHHLDVRV